MAIDERQINALVDAVVQKLAPRIGGQMPVQTARADYVVTYGQRRASASGTGRRGIFEDVDSAVAAARDAHEQLLRLDLETRGKMIQAMREVTARNAEDLSRRAVEETKLGRVEDKIQKNLLVAWKTPGIEILRPISYTGDHGLTLIERAPFGVIAGITPTTNPTETILCNAIGMLAGGNTVVFNVHPSAKRVSRYHVEMLNDAIVAAGGPENCICSVAEPTIESSQALMKHKGTRLVVVTGGPAVVKTAMASGKRAICAGPGNPPCVVDETAHIDRAGREIVKSASFDNNVICILEKEIFAVASIADRLKEAMCAHGAYEVKGEAIRRLEKLVVAEDGAHPSKDWVGRDAAKIARAAGIDVPEKTRLLLAEVDAMHPFVQAELLMPVMGFVRVPTVDDAIACALQAEHGFGHTATMHSTNIDNLSRMARAVNTSIFVKNGGALAGLGVDGEGYTSFTIASPTGEGITTALSFTRERRCSLKDSFRIV
ncbi:MAG TPA: aldehyde dehydrogenase EutE [Myxococcales bacterium]|nr:aldehyde dehydrogenase EutE [Myxococcales bacterium]